MKVTAFERDAAKISLLDDYGLEAGSTVVTLVTHVTRSGMSRSIRIFTIGGRRGLTEITYRVHQYLGLPLDNANGGVKVGGCGMDMGFHVVYNLSSLLLGDGYALNQEWL